MRRLNNWRFLVRLTNLWYDENEKNSLLNHNGANLLAPILSQKIYSSFFSGFIKMKIHKIMAPGGNGYMDRIYLFFLFSWFKIYDKTVSTNKEFYKIYFR